MNDPIAVMVRFVTWIFCGIGILIGDGLAALFNIFIQWKQRAPREPESVQLTRRSQEDEEVRIAGCKKMTLDFAKDLGYIARQCMTRQELDDKIYKERVTPDELAGELRSRIAKVPGITLGQRHYTDCSLDVKLPFSLRDRHCYLIGRSGSGKTNLIRGMLLQDIYYGRGVGVLAPEEELLTEEILPYIPDNRIDDVIYVNPLDNIRPVAFNPLTLEQGESIEEKVDDFVTIFKRAVGDTGFRMDQILSETLYALIQHKGSTLDDIERFLSRSNPVFRNEVLKSADERTRVFFEETYPTMDKNAANPVISRISAFTRREAVRNILCKPGASFNFRHAMDEGKILLFNLSDGKLGVQASQLLGQIIVSKMQLAAMSRVDTPAANRRPFYLYLDEFQTFTGAAETSYANILSRARKYKLGLVIAHQQTGQISQKLLKEIFGNVTTFIVFNVSSEDAGKLSQEYVFEYGAVMDFVPAEEFLRLKTGEAIAKIDRTVFPIETYLLPTPPNPEKVEVIINRSRKNYGHGGNGGGWSTDIKRPPQLPPKFPALPPSKQDDIDPSRVF